jgi:hypothetical protein
MNYHITLNSTKYSYSLMLFQNKFLDTNLGHIDRTIGLTNIPSNHDYQKYQSTVKRTNFDRNLS